jgi:flagella basal body P-ring formation protein FlgA
MMFGLAQMKCFARAAAAAGLLIVVSLAIPSAAAADDMGVAVVPRTIIYPGQEISSAQIQTVPVTNPNLTEGYARTVQEVTGMISNRTLVPGRTIMVSGLRRPYAVKRGDKAKLVYDSGTLRITASGTPMADANVGDLISVRNTDTGVMISGTVMADGSILVAQK